MSIINEKEVERKILGVDVTGIKESDPNDHPEVQENLPGIEVKKDPIKLKVSDFPKLTKPELIQCIMKAKVDYLIKKVTGMVSYTLSFGEEELDRELELTVKLSDGEGDDPKPHAIVMGKELFIKKDFLTLYTTFDTVISKAVNDILAILEKTKPESAQMVLEGVETGQDLFMNNININNPFDSAYKGKTINTSFDVLSNGKDRHLLKFGNLRLTKEDIYFIYNRYDQIVEKLLGDHF